MSEPVLAGDEIQGNILPGFNKDYQALVALHFGDVASARAWLASLIPVVSTLREVEQFKRLFEEWRAGRKEGERIPSELWARAVAASVEHGAYRVSAELHLDYGEL